MDIKQSNSLNMDIIKWKCGQCFKVFNTNKQLQRHLVEWHQFTECKYCGKTLKKGSILRHTQIYHKEFKSTQPTDLFTEEEITRLNTLLDNRLSYSLEELMNNINKEESQVFNNIDMTDYLKVFDEATNKDSAEPTEEEFKQIQDYWINIDQEEFQQKEQDLLEWAAIRL